MDTGEKESLRVGFYDRCHRPKKTEEIYLTSTPIMVSLSNGLLMSSTQNNGDGKNRLLETGQTTFALFIFLGNRRLLHKKIRRDKEVIAYTFPKYKKT